MTIDVQILLLMRSDQLVPITEWLCVLRQCAVEGFPVGCDETNCAVVEYEDDDIAFVHLSVMETAETDEVRELGLAAVCPVQSIFGSASRQQRCGAGGVVTRGAELKMDWTKPPALSSTLWGLKGERGSTAEC
jgi:hypothetical protein